MTIYLVAPDDDFWLTEAFRTHDEAEAYMEASQEGDTIWSIMEVEV